VLTAVAPEAFRAQVQSIADADLVVSMGGGYLNAPSGMDGTLSLYLMLFPMMIAEGLTKCVVMAPQSVGPFSNPLQRAMARWTLNRVQLLELREDISIAIAQELRISAPMSRYPDMGFVFGGSAPVDVRELLHLPADQLLIGVTVRQWLPSDEQERYEGAIAATIDTLCHRHGAAVILIPQVTSNLGNDDDRLVNRRVYGRLHDRTNVRLVDDHIDHRQIKAFYASLDLLIGTRFHSVIFALTSYVPSIAVAYEHKTTGIMRDLGLEKWVVDIRAVDETVLTQRAESLLLEAPSYRSYLEEVLPPYIDEAKHASEMMAEVFARSTS
jgi:colanic acid/amylovoran biosynthesis protein